MKYVGINIVERVRRHKPRVFFFARLGSLAGIAPSNV